LRWRRSFRSSIDPSIDAVATPLHPSVIMAVPTPS
jgi:hypothetical protein